MKRFLFLYLFISLAPSLYSGAVCCKLIMWPQHTPCYYARLNVCSEVVELQWKPAGTVSAQHTLLEKKNIVKKDIEEARMWTSFFVSMKFGTHTPFPQSRASSLAVNSSFFINPQFILFIMNTELCSIALIVVYLDKIYFLFKQHF